MLQWLGSGLQLARIAERMDISPRTVKFHLKNAHRKLGAASCEHALAKALLDGFFEL
ncbi:MAG: helix-turn-helix transcriptional regulator [Paracoccaceae bacterium]